MLLVFLFIVLVMIYVLDKRKNKYYNFWGDFKDSDGYAQFFDNMTGGDCNIYTNFGTEVPIPNRGTNIYWSGEPYHKGGDMYDINIVMNENVPNSIIYPLFAIDSYKDWDTYKKPRILTVKDRFCAFVVSNCEASVRKTFFEKLSTYKKVHSYGRCMNNTDDNIPKGAGQDYLDFMGRHKFVICFENSKSKYYLTEKLKNAWLSGSIPIYYGSEMVLKWLNPKSFLYLKDDSDQSMKELIDKIIELDNDDDKYRKMFEQPLLVGDVPEMLRSETLKKYISSHKK